MRRRTLIQSSQTGELQRITQSLPRITKSLPKISLSGFSFSGISFSGISFSGIKDKEEQPQNNAQLDPTETDQKQHNDTPSNESEKLPVTVPQRSDTDKLEKLPVTVPPRTDHLN